MRARIALLALSLALSGCGWFGGAHPLSGTVKDASGQPLAGVAVASDQAAALTDANGHFDLADSAGTLTAHKVGYSPLTFTSDQAGRLSMRPTNQPIRIAWDQRWQGPAMDGLIGYLKSQGFQVTTYASGEPPRDQDVYVLPCPSWFSQDGYAQYLRLAGSGAKIVVLGEWGGYDGIDLNACNALASKAGVTFAAATVRTYDDHAPEEWLTLQLNGPKGIADGLDHGIRLFTAGALDVKAPGVSLVRTNDDGVRIQAWSRGPQTLLGAGPLGRGSLLALADTSLWTDETNADGTPHWKTLDNPTFAVNLVKY